MLVHHFCITLEFCRFTISFLWFLGWILDEVALRFVAEMRSCMR
jgi:hypothetical protein